MQCVIDSNDVQEFLGVMIPELDGKPHRRMLTALSEIVGCDATELDEITGISTTTIVKDKSEIKNTLRDPRVRLSSLKRGRVRASVWAVSPHRRRS